MNVFIIHTGSDYSYAVCGIYSSFKKASTMIDHFFEIYETHHLVIVKHKINKEDFLYGNDDMNVVRRVYVKTNCCSKQKIKILEVNTMGIDDALDDNDIINKISCKYHYKK